MKAVKIQAGWPTSLLLLSLLSALSAPSWADEKTRAAQLACGTRGSDPAADGRPTRSVSTIWWSNRDVNW